MRVAAVASAAAFLLASCSQGSNTAASVSPSAGPAASPVVSPSPSSPACTSGPAYGLLFVGGSLQMISPCGTVAASAPVVAPSAKFCYQASAPAVLQPPVSATNDKV